MWTAINILILKILFILTGLSRLSASTNPLQGRRAQCLLEGEPVPVDHIDRSNCVSCICKNGFVVCNYYCPLLDGCHMVIDKTKDECCRKCKGCLYNGDYHSSHTEWIDSTNPCKVIRCEAGVITESDLQCYTPCSNSVPPEPGKCCPTCPECRINGQEATDDTDVISDDPCVKCRCNKGRMTCAKKACPVLQCTQSRQYHLPGECCPRCNGTRLLLAVPNRCLFQDSIFQENQKFGIDRCTICLCKNETSICKRPACPILDCSQDLQVSVPGSCCKQCSIPQQFQTQCIQGGKHYEEGQSWKLDACGSCKCQRGWPSCAMVQCNVTLPCPPGTKSVHKPGECCRKCVEVEGSCMVFGDPHYKTFDGKIYTFQGVGRYHLVSDCHSQLFSLRVANDLLNKTFVSTRRLAVRYHDMRLNLQQRGKIKVNKEKVRLPFTQPGMFLIEKVNGYTEVTFQNGIKIVWSGKSFLEVTAPAKFKNKLCGLCGNFNGNVQDELRTKRGTLLKDHEVVPFGVSWCAGSKAVCNRNKIIRNPVCNYRYERTFKNRCKLLTNPDLFGECESKLNYSKYYKTCKMDMCKCPNNKCYCDSLLAYARECERLGVNLPRDWRMKSACYEEKMKRNKPSKPQVYSYADIEKFKKQKHFNKSKNPILIH